METPYHISNTPELLMGCGSIESITGLTTRYKGPVLIITGGSTGENIRFLPGFLGELKSGNRFAGLVKIIHEPSPDDIDAAAKRYQEM